MDAYWIYLAYGVIDIFLFGIRLFPHLGLDLELACSSGKPDNSYSALLELHTPSCVQRLAFKRAG